MHIQVGIVQGGEYILMEVIKNKVILIVMILSDNYYIERDIKIQRNFKSKNK